ncbi:MAG: DHA2 family efflux MFS transporter permease subunit [Tractidigestivibacter sp.]|jgi:DHA2 family lincomycin resistance protein-like MFS transporter|uniref:DHA2 family efflux MFS transporter permease subunit n=1 Tax=Tractidigestivibacter sp. TaxID=2847320 RepID=UPI003D8CF518
MQQSTTPTGGFERRLDAKLILSIVATGIMSFSGVTVETAMNVTFPTLMAEFGIDTSTVQWMTTSYLLVLAIIVPTSSYLNRRFPTRRIFVTAMLFYIAGIVCGLTAISFPMLLMGRILEGIGTGIALPLMFNIITEQAPEKNMGVMMGIGTLVTAMAPAVGPSVGGWLAENFGWRAIFAALLPILVVSFFLGIFSIRQSHEVVRDSFDVPGWLFIAGSFASLVFAVDMGATWGWTSPLELTMLALFIIFLALFIRRERSVEDPLIHLSVFSEKRFDFGVLAIVCLQFIVLGLSFLIPNYSQVVMGAGETEAGSILLYGCIVGACMAPLSGQLLDRLGARKPILFGASCALLGTLLFALFSDHLATLPAICFYIVFALGQSTMVGNTMTTSLGFLPAQTKPDGNAVINTLQQLSGAIGTSVCSAIVNAAQLGASDMALATMTGSRIAYALLACIAIVPLASMTWVTSPRNMQRR